MLGVNGFHYKHFAAENRNLPENNRKL